MKYATLAVLGIGLAIGSSIAEGQAPASKGEAEMKTIEQKFSYFYGLKLGQSMKQQAVVLDADLLARGIKDGLADKAIFTEAQLQEIEQEFRKVMMAKQAAAESAAVKKAAASDPEAQKSLKAGEAFLEANKKKPGVKTLASGVQYKVLKSGTGKTPKLTDTVLANYKGTLIDGTPFDSSYDRGEPSEFPVNRVIAGWTEVLQLMKVGDKWEVYIPTELAYGANPRPGKIKPFDALIFEMELVQVK